MRTRLTILTIVCAMAARSFAAGDNGHEHDEGGKGDGHAHGAAAAERDEGGHAEEKGHAGHAAGNLSLEERMKATCEHKVQTYRCDACRFEVGFVKISPELLKADGGRVPLIRVETVGKRKIESFVEVTGEVRLNENATVHVTPRIPGAIRSVAADAGSVVKAGDVLLEMESVELGEAQAAYLKSLVLSQLALRALDRERSLFEKKVGAEADLIEAQMRYEEHRADKDGAAHKLTVLGMTEAEVAAIKPDDRSRLTGRIAVRASLPGVVVDRHATVGEQVEPGRDLFTVSDLSTPWVWLDFYERDLEALLARMKAGPVPVSVEVAAFSGHRFDGAIDHVAAVMSEDTRTIRARAVVPNPDGRLRPGMFCRARVSVGGGDRVLGVPRNAVLSDEGADFVFKRIEGDLYARVSVRTGRDGVEFVEIVEGLREGDAVVDRGSFLLKSDVLREKMGAGCAD